MIEEEIKKETEPPTDIGDPKNNRRSLKVRGDESSGNHHFVREEVVGNSNICCMGNLIFEVLWIAYIQK